MEKRCFKCLCVKPLFDFYKHATMGDGHLNKCKECTKRDANEHRQSNLERVRAYDKMRGSMPHRVAARKEYAKTPEGRLSKKRALKVSAIRFPEKYVARIAFRNAVRDGKVTPLPCFVCGEPAEGHHPVYDMPLDVVWLCPPHHREAHKIKAA